MKLTSPPPRPDPAAGGWESLLRRLAREVCPDPHLDEPPTGRVGPIVPGGSRPAYRDLTQLQFDAEMRRLRAADEPLRIGGPDESPAGDPAAGPPERVSPAEPEADRDDVSTSEASSAGTVRDLGVETAEHFEPADLSLSNELDRGSRADESSELGEWTREMLAGARAILDAAAEATGVEPKTGDFEEVAVPGARGAPAGTTGAEEPVTGAFEDVDVPASAPVGDPVEAADVFEPVETLRDVGGRRRRRRRVREWAELRIFPPLAPLVRLLLGRHDWDDVRPWRWWARTVFEIALVYLLIVIAESMFPGPIGGFKVHPHPYWIAIIPIAAARGAIAGLVAAAVGTGLYTLAAIQVLETADPRVLLDPQQMLEPILFFAVAFVVGDFRDVAEARRQRLKRILGDERDDNARLRHERSVLREANSVLERRLVDQASQFGSLLATARRIDGAESHDAHELVLELVDAHCGAVASILVPLEDGSLDVTCHRGWADHEVADRLAVARRSPFVKEALADGVAVSAFEPGVAPPAEGPLAVAPLFGPRGVVRGLLCLDAVPTYRLNPSTLASFFGIAEWASATLARAERSARSGSADAARAEAPLTFAVGPEGDLWLGDAEELGERLRLDYERATRYGVPTSLVLIQAIEWRDLDARALRRLDGFVLSHFTGGLRPSDGLYRFGYPGCWVLVLSGTAVDGAGVVRERLVRIVEAAREDDIGAFEVTVTAPDAGAPDLPSLLARVTDQFRRRSALRLDAGCPVTVPDRLRAGDVEDFLRRLRIEISLALRSGLELHVLGIFPDTRTADAAACVARHVVAIADDSLRRSDGVYALGAFGAAVILPGTGREAAERLGERVLECLATRDRDAPYGAVELTVLTYGTSHPDPMSFLDALADAEREVVTAAPAGGAGGRDGAGPAGGANGRDGRDGRDGCAPDDEDDEDDAAGTDGFAGAASRRLDPRPDEAEIPETEA